MKATIIVLLLILFVYLIAKWVRNRIIAYKENKRFWQKVEMMIKENDKKFHDSFIKFLENEVPDILKKMKAKRDLSNTNDIGQKQL